MELVIGLTIFAIGILPLFWMGSRSTSSAFNASRYLLATEIARSLLERYRALPWAACLQALSAADRPRPVLDDPMIEEVARVPELAELVQDLRRQLQGYQYSVTHTADRSQDPRCLRLKVTVFWPRERGDEGPPLATEMEALKFREDP